MVSSCPTNTLFIRAMEAARKYLDASVSLKRAGVSILQVLKEAKQATGSTLELGNQFHPTLSALACIERQAPSFSWAPLADDRTCNCNALELDIDKSEPRLPASKLMKM